MSFFASVMNHIGPDFLLRLSPSGVNRVFAFLWKASSAQYTGHFVVFSAVFSYCERGSPSYNFILDLCWAK